MLPDDIDTFFRVLSVYNDVITRDFEENNISKRQGRRKHKNKVKRNHPAGRTLSGDFTLPTAFKGPWIDAIPDSYPLLHFRWGKLTFNTLAESPTSSKSAAMAFCYVCDFSWAHNGGTSKNRF